MATLTAVPVRFADAAEVVRDVPDLQRDRAGSGVLRVQLQRVGARCRGRQHLGQVVVAPAGDDAGAVRLVQGEPARRRRTCCPDVWMSTRLLAAIVNDAVAFWPGVVVSTVEEPLVAGLTARSAGTFQMRRLIEPTDHVGRVDLERVGASRRERQHVGQVVAVPAGDDGGAVRLVQGDRRGPRVLRVARLEHEALASRHREGRSRVLSRRGEDAGCSAVERLDEVLVGRDDPHLCGDRARRRCQPGR